MHGDFSGTVAVMDTKSTEVPVCGFLHTPACASSNGLVLTHGAGANCDSPLLVALATALCASGLTVLRCDLPFRQSRPHGPPPRGSAELDQQGLRAAVAVLKRTVTGHIFLGGHSYGGRQASLLAATEPKLANALLLLSYPLHPPKRPTELRTNHFPNLLTPSLFIHGVRDGFGTIGEMERALNLIPADTQLIPVPAAGHELITKKNADALPTNVANAFREFLKKS